MIASRASLDHLTVAALTLEEGIAHVQRALDVVIPPGGSHPLMGTHNHLMQLGNGIFLEVIAPDHTVTPQRTRWFGLDDPGIRGRLKNSPRLISWVVRVPDLAQALREIDGAIGEPVPVTRGTLSWLISVPHDGSMPFDGAFPTLIEWPVGPHPSTRMAGFGCQLKQLSIVHPEAARLSKMLDPVITDDRIVISTGPTTQIRATINTPSGHRRLA
jgi:Glyoxalase-like domain